MRDNRRLKKVSPLEHIQKIIADNQEKFKNEFTDWGTELVESCQICESRENLTLDICEETGTIFGTLCERCRSLVIHLDRDPEKISRLLRIAKLEADGLIRRETLPDGSAILYDLEAEAGRTSVILEKKDF